MAHGAEVSYIEQLEQAAAAVPPNVALARTAIIGVGDELHHVGREERARLVQRTAELTDQIAEALVVSDDDTNEAVLDEFSAYSNAYSAMATILGERATKQDQPTQTAGKSMTGGKR